MSFQEAGVVIPVVETQPKERISDEEIGDLISAIGNSEAKAITLGLMQPSTLYSMQDANLMVSAAQGQFKGWKQGTSTPFDYMSHAFAPVGLVAQEVTISNDLETVCFVKTPKGENYGDVLAGLLLDFSLRHPETSLGDLFGSMSSKYARDDATNTDQRNRAPILRFKIFWELVSQPGLMTETSLTEQLQKPHSIIGPHLSDLAEKGVIVYTSQDISKPFTIYSLDPSHPDADPTIFQRKKSSTQVVYDALRANPEKKWTTAELVDYCLSVEDPDGKLNKKSYATRVRGILGHLVKGGYVDTENSTNERSSVNLSDDQRVLLTELVTMIDSFQNLDTITLQYGRNRLTEILSDSRTVAAFMAKSKEHSPYARRNSVDLTLNDLRQIIINNPGYSTNQIREELAKIQGKKRSRGNINNLLLKLVDQGGARVVNGKVLNYYYIDQELM